MTVTTRTVASTMMPPATATGTVDQLRQRQQRRRRRHHQQSIAIADALSGVTGTLVSLWVFYPLDVIKINVQAASASAVDDDPRQEDSSNRTAAAASMSSTSRSLTTTVRSRIRQLLKELHRRRRPEFLPSATAKILPWLWMEIPAGIDV